MTHKFCGRLHDHTQFVLFLLVIRHENALGRQKTDAIEQLHELVHLGSVQITQLRHTPTQFLQLFVTLSPSLASGQREHVLFDCVATRDLLSRPIELAASSHR